VSEPRSPLSPRSGPVFSPPVLATSSNSRLPRRAPHLLSPRALSSRPSLARPPAPASLAVGLPAWPLPTPRNPTASTAPPSSSRLDDYLANAVNDFSLTSDLVRGLNVLLVDRQMDSLLTPAHQPVCPPQQPAQEHPGLLVGRPHDRGHRQQVLLYNSTPVDFSGSTNITFDVKLDAQAWSTTRFAASATTPRSSSPPQAARRSLTMRTSRRSPTPASTSHTLRSSSSSSQDQTTPHDPASWELLSDFRVCFSRMSRAGLEHHGALPTDAHVLFTVFRDTEGQTCHLDHNLTLAVCAQFLTTRPVPPLYGTLLYFHISLAHSVITVRFGDSPCGLLDLALLHLPALSVTHSPCE